MDSPNPTPNLKDIRESIIKGRRVTMPVVLYFSTGDPPRVCLQIHDRGGNVVVTQPGEVLVMSLLMQALTGAVDGERWVRVSAYHRRCDVDRVPEEIPTTEGARPRFPDAIFLTPDEKTREAWLNEKAEAILTEARLKIRLWDQNAALKRYRDRVRALYRTMREPRRLDG